MRKITDDDRVLDAIETRARWALNNHDGKNTEELYAISLSEKREDLEIARVTGQQTPYGVKRTPLFRKKLDEADKLGEKILLIHNHPRGLPPSIGDINSLLYTKNASGITVGHDGSIYYYTRPKKPISESDFFIANKRYSMYSEITGMEKALQELSVRFGFELVKLR